MNPKLAHMFQRRSIRAYRDQPVAPEMVRELLEAAMAAPSAVAKDPWRFAVVTRRDLLSAIADVLPHGKMLARAPLGIVVCGSIEEAHDRQISYLLQDTSAAIENLLLAAAALGLGACWLGVHPREDRIAGVRKTLKIPDGIIPVAAIAIGHPAEEKPPRTRYDESRVIRESW